jgi:NADPH2:quinone reductase
LGVDHPINYRTEDFAARIREIQGESAGLDVIFDPIGGKTLANGLKLLAAGGRLMAFGGSSMTEAKNWFAKIRIGLSFGFYHPIAMLSPSRSLMGVNMLKLADQRPLTFARAFQRSLELTEAGILQPLLGGSYPAEQLAEAHQAFETRKTTGKLVMTW